MKPPVPNRGLSRRSFLVDGVRLTAIGSALASSPVAALTRTSRSRASDRVLVVVQLSGGNDGLNTVVPHGQDEYFRARPTIGLKPDSLHVLDDETALHPNLGEVAELYREGRLAIVHGVGHPAADRSHFRSLEIWHTAEPFAPAGRVGWLGNMADQILAREPGSLPALSVGGRSTVLSMRGANAVPPTVPDDRGFRLSHTSRQIAKERDAIAAARTPDGSDLAFLRAAARTSYDAAERMSAITRDDGAGGYPDHPFGRELRLVGQLIRGGFGTRIFHVSLSGFDTHASQRPVHDALMQRLSQALSAFQRDLEDGGVAERVSTLVFSEFGRRVHENGSRGTDHGRGNPVLLMGGAVRAGQHGTRPDLEKLVEGDIPSTTDFRGIYRQLEEDWMGLRSFHGERIDAPRVI